MYGTVVEKSEKLIDNHIFFVQPLVLEILHVVSIKIKSSTEITEGLLEKRSFKFV